MIWIILYSVGVIICWFWFMVSDVNKNKKSFKKNISFFLGGFLSWLFIIGVIIAVIGMNIRSRKRKTNKNKHKQ